MIKYLSGFTLFETLLGLTLLAICSHQLIQSLIFLHHFSDVPPASAWEIVAAERGPGGDRSHPSQIKSIPLGSPPETASKAVPLQLPPAWEEREILPPSASFYFVR